MAKTWGAQGYCQKSKLAGVTFGSAEAIVFDYEERIRSLTKAFVDESDPEKIKALAEELIRLLSLEKKPWLYRRAK